MKPSISILCQPDALGTAAEITRLVAQLDFPIVTNFPCSTPTTVTNRAATIVSDHTALVILLVSPGWFNTSRNHTGNEIEPATIQRLFAFSRGAQSTRLFPIILTEDLVDQVEGIWLGRIQWYLDNTESRNRLMSVLERIDELIDSRTVEAAFDGMRTVLAAVEPASTIELSDEVRVREDRIAYDIYTATHRFHQTKTVYIHIYRGIPIAKTAEHIRMVRKIDTASTNVFFYLSHEHGQSKLEERIDNLKRQLASKNVRYIEDVVAQLISQANFQAVGTSVSASEHYFIEPQIRRSVISAESRGSDFSRITDWLQSTEAGVIVLEGHGGIGKTWTMQELFRRVISGEVEFERRLQRRAIFISSNEINRPGSTLNDATGSISLYDLYYASVARKDPELRGEILTRDTFYSAITIGNIVIFVDGLDEVIARHRARFSPDSFFGDIQGRISESSNAKIFISCRTLFFDHFEYESRFPIVQSYELLAFDANLRDKYFGESLGRLDNQIKYGKELSDRLALIPGTNRYVPFVLSLIVDILVEKADQTPVVNFRDFNSDRLDASDYSDRIIGQFCDREIMKIGDPLRCLTVDQQVQIFEQIAVMDESANGKPNSKLVSELIRSVTQLRSVSDLTDTFLSHPFLSVTRVGNDNIVDLRFDFMREHFLMLYLTEKMRGDEELDSLDISIFMKYCSDRSGMSEGLAKRLGKDDDEFGLLVIDLHKAGEKLLLERFSGEEFNILRPGSPASEFSHSIISLIYARLRISGKLSTETFTRSIVDIFATDNVISRLALVDTVHSDGTRTRIDFRGLTLSECLFQSVDIWSCYFDSRTFFTRCRFIACDGVRARDSGITEKTFDANCIFDDTFEKVFRSGQDRVNESQSRVKTDIRAFVSNFFSGGVFEDFTEDYLVKHYIRHNPSVAIKKMLRTFRYHEVVVLNPKKVDKPWFMISPRYHEEAMRLITQNTFSGKIKEIAEELV